VLLCHWVLVHAWPAWNIKDPAQIAVVVSDAAVVPAVALAHIIGVVAVVDETVAVKEIPSGRECEIYAIDVIHGSVVSDGVIAAVIGQMQTLLVIQDSIALQKVVIAVIIKINASGAVHGQIVLQ